MTFSVRPTTSRIRRTRVAEWLRRGLERSRRARVAVSLRVKALVGPDLPGLNYWRKPEVTGLTRAYWDDPRPDLQGMLNAEAIVMYHKKIGGMIRPFDPKLLKPASYELTLGHRYMVEGKEKILTERRPHLVIPQNSIVFVSMQQVLCLPHYIVGRFDLAIIFIYRGLLLGTGPQVDPGFQGGLGCPLHNISNEDIEMRLGDSFAKIDFVKTVGRDPETKEHWQKLSSESELTAWLRENPNSNVKLFKGGEPEWREPIFGYTGGHRPTSSVQQVTKVIRRFRRYSIIGIATVGLAVAALVFTALELKGGEATTRQELQRVRDCETALYTEITSEIKESQRTGKALIVEEPNLCAR
jgi:deoxycytidine triphosphate deaminase